MTEFLLGRHEDDYVPGRQQLLAPSWPTASPSRSIDDWLIEIRSYFLADSVPQLFGIAVILGAGLSDPSAGRAMEGSGLLHQLALQMRPPVAATLTQAGREALAALPIEAATAGVALPRTIRLSKSGEAVAISADSRRGAGRLADGAMTVWDLRRGLVSWSDTNFADPLDGLWLNRTGSILFSAFAGQVSCISETDRSPVLLPFSITSPSPSSTTPPPAIVAAVSDTGDAVAVGYPGGLVKVYSLQSNVPVETSTLQHQTGINFSGLVLRGSHLLSATDGGALWLWDLSTGSQLAMFQIGALGVTRATMSAAADVIATGNSQGSIQLWNASGIQISSPTPPTSKAATSLAFSADETMLASGSEDGSATVWRRVSDGLVELGRLPHGIAPVTSLAFDPNGAFLQTVASDGLARRWNLLVEPALVPTYVADQMTEQPTHTWIDDDVDAFARLIVSRHMSPPLSIGIFGDWGSGKTFFMHRLRQRVFNLSRRARQLSIAQREVGYYKHVAQVEFNAWHYAGADLWASLVDHIFTQLWIDNDPAASRSRLERVFEDSRKQDAEALKAASIEVRILRDERNAAASDATAVREAAQQAKTDLADLQAREDAAVQSFIKALGEEALASLKAAGYSNLSGGLTHVLAVTGKARRTLEDAGFVSAVLRAPDRRKRLLLLLGALAIPVVAGVLIHVWLPVNALKDLVGVATGLVGLVGFGLGWVQQQTDWVEKQRSVLSDVDQKAKAQLKEEADELQAKRKVAKETFENATRELAEATAREAAAAERLKQREAEIASGNPATLLSRLIGDRAQGDYYRKHLGLLALIRRDFEALSEYVERDRLKLEDVAFAPTEEAASDTRRINRIVLYIDDLDRCPPPVVVKVLEAIHLLLSFPMFVVVVGVDARWVSRALALKYPDLLAEQTRGRGEGSASPFDYLEKIFQVPYWIERLEPERTRRMIEQLIGRPLIETAQQPAPITTAGSDSATDQPANGEVQSAQTAGIAAQSIGSSAEDLSPKSMELTGQELECIDEIAQLLLHSPRALKRFLNIYRILRTKNFNNGFTEDDGPGSDYRVVLFLLAIVTSQPEGGRTFFAELMATTSVINLVTLVDGAVKRNSALKALQDWVHLPANAGWSLTLDALRNWAPEVVRYSFYYPVVAHSELPDPASSDVNQVELSSHGPSA